ncbi:MAG: hypothetical protein WAX66_00940 [Patescibacteria group bacterium]|jgi:hypothetical protein
MFKILIYADESIVDKFRKIVKNTLLKEELETVATDAFPGLYGPTYGSVPILIVPTLHHEHSYKVKELWIEVYYSAIRSPKNGQEEYANSMRNVVRKYLKESGNEGWNVSLAVIPSPHLFMVSGHM